MSLTPYTGQTGTIRNIGTTPAERGMSTPVFKGKFSDDFDEYVAWFNGTHLLDIESLLNVNIIDNSNFDINQRAVSGTVTLSAGKYGHDRWKAGASGCTYTFATSAGVRTLTISAGSLIQVIDGAELLTGTYCLSWSGTAQGKIGAGSYGASGITGSATGGSNLSIEFGTGTLSRVKFEPGAISTPYRKAKISSELMHCQRYCIAFPANRRMRANQTATNTMDFTVPVPVEMRTTPSIEVSGLEVNNLASGVVQSGFTFAVLNFMAGVIVIRATKTSHGLTDGSLNASTLTIFSADL
jgi:hypothetical protein